MPLEQREMDQETLKQTGVKQSFSTEDRNKETGDGMRSTGSPAPVPDPGSG